MILRSPLTGTGQPGRHECRTSSRDTGSIFAVKGGGPLGLGVGPVSDVGETGAGEGVTDPDDGDPGDAAEEPAGAGESDAGAAGAVAGGGFLPDAPASPSPPQPVTPATAAITIADLRIHKEVIGAGYPRASHPPGAARDSCGQRDPCGQDPAGCANSGTEPGLAYGSV